MRILAFESSAKAVSVALLTDGVLTAESYQNDGQTHSRTMMKLAEDLLNNCELAPADLDLVAWANGPGSFTGVRIGAAAAKGLCWGAELPCVPVSTLEAMAWNAVDLDGVICCCMDARRNQVYNALFRAENGQLLRLRPDRAISLAELHEDLKGFSEPIRLVGDGAALAWGFLQDAEARAEAGGTNACRCYRLLAEHHRQQRASGVALAAYVAAQNGVREDPGTVTPNYLRLSQAERERLEKEKEQKGDMH
ncbi:MAG: tRNA (adenosine(37)-N6)-threonylcarbamoyltransferase complex dimerization subunit type 1 TsaB [Oscillospiraceae bacterium]|nr:tRNA (adenosine(37)-N6)-threonylcarbamoyltransferase complex dimerization subunit type 1 TsaB [Oscillospiraceae bacterium]